MFTSRQHFVKQPQGFHYKIKLGNLEAQATRVAQASSTLGKQFPAEFSVDNGS